MPLQNTYEHRDCNVAAALEILGERWTLLVVRSVMLDAHRFEELRTHLGVASNVLQSRLGRLVEHEVLEKRMYQERPPRFEYHLTDKGLDLWPAVVSLMHWGDTYLQRPAPLVFEHRGCGGCPDGHRLCDRCGKPLGLDDVEPLPGPGAAPDHPLRCRQETQVSLGSTAN